MLYECSFYANLHVLYMYCIIMCIILFVVVLNKSLDKLQLLWMKHKSYLQFTVTLVQSTQLKRSSFNYSLEAYRK